MAGAHPQESSRHGGPPKKLDPKSGLYPGEGLHLVKGALFNKALLKGDLRHQGGIGEAAAAGLLTIQSPAEMVPSGLPWPIYQMMK